MNALCRALAVVSVGPSAMAGSSPSAWAGAIVWAVYPVSGDILQVDPPTGAVVGGIRAPLTPDPGDTRLGLSSADRGQTLLYQLGNNGPGTEVPGREALYRLVPFTGAIKSQELGLTTSFGPDGISWQSRKGSTFTVLNHANPIPDIHRIKNLDRPDEQEVLSWGPTQRSNYSLGGLDGEGEGREFGVFLDVDNLYGGHRFIGEHDPFVDDPELLNAFVAPADDIVGLAFGGRYLYASAALFSLDPDTGSVVHATGLPLLAMPDGSRGPYRLDIAAAMPEPTPLARLGLGAVGLAFAVRWSLTAQR